MNYYTFTHNVTASADPQMNNTSVRRLWNSFCLTDGNITLTTGTGNTFRLGDTALPTLPEGKEYALRIDETGAAIIGRDYGGLMRGFMSLLMKIEYDKDCFRLPALYEESNYTIRNRMLHICIFPENDLYFIKKVIRLAGLCQYTHIVIEFWGMLKYDCLKELSWPNAFTKEESKELIREIREFGMEPIPMLNQLGHATASRVCYGKHVVLDQNPRLQHLFTPDGWAWNIHSPEVFALLKEIRSELYEVFGEGEYMHIGCDEAYYYTRCEEERMKLPDYLSHLTNEVAKEGRRPMLWMDMLLEQDKFASCYTTCAPEEVAKINNALHPSTVKVDWQYDATAVPVPTLDYLKEDPCDVIGAPWLNKANYRAHAETITKLNLFGIMLTTWHTLQKQMPGILGCAGECGAVTFPWSKFSGLHEETATLLRRVSFEGNTYADCGWSKEQIEV